MSAYKGPGEICIIDRFRVDKASCGDRDDFDNDISGDISYRESDGVIGMVMEVFSTGGVLYCELYDRASGEIGYVMTVHDLLKLLDAGCRAIGRELPGSQGDT
jgi:hypothetical protein